MKYFILLGFFISFNIHANDLATKFKNKRYKEVASVFFNKSAFNKTTQKEKILISYSLRATGHYRNDTKLIAAFIKQNFSEYHSKIHALINKKVTLDSDDYPKPLLVLYWNIYNDYAAIILSHKKNNPQLQKDLKYFHIFRSILSELEFREGKVEKTNDSVMTHLQYLKDIEYSYSRNWTVSYVSWQAHSSLNRLSNNTSTKMITTNQGICAGGDIGIENGFNHFALEGCVMAGSGGVTAYGDTEIQYQQTVSAFGLKMGPSYYRIISSSKTRIGFSLPILLTLQSLTQPEDPEYQVEEDSPFSFIPSLSSRWQFDKWYIKTEFGKYLGKNGTFWGFGTGRSF